MKRINKLTAAVLIGCVILMFPGITLGDDGSGGASVTGESVTTQAEGPVTVSIEGSPALIKAGASGVEIPAIIIAETIGGGIDATAEGRNQLMLEFPQDVVPTIPDKVEVTEGDIVIDQNSVACDVLSDGRWYITVDVRSTSTVPSRIRFSGVKLDVYRTVPNGDLKVIIKGGAVVQTLDDFPGYDSIDTVKVAEVVSPAEQAAAYKSAFRIGETRYTVNGLEKDMDAASYVNVDGRTMLPARFVALAIGGGIIWDDAAKTATLMKGDKVVQVKVGSTTMMVNGVAVTMDAAPEIVDGRAMLPLRSLGQAFGAAVDWDAATSTATINLN